MLRFIIDIIIKILLWLLSFFITITIGYGQYYINSDTSGKIVISGNLNWEQWQQAAGWENYTAADYLPDSSKINIIKEIVKDKNISFFIFGGSWCGDSKSEMPKIFKLLELCEIKEDIIHLYGLDRAKDEPSGTARNFSIEKVPTLVILIDGKDSGRIVEYPSKSWEEDILGIIK